MFFLPTLKSAFVISFGAVATGSFPANTDGLLMWLDANTITGSTNNSYLDTWPDRSPHSVSVISYGVSNNRPIYKTSSVNGYPSVYFSSGAFFINPINTFQQYTSSSEIFLVFKSDADPTTDASWHGPISIDGMQSGDNALPYTDGLLYEPFATSGSSNPYVSISKPKNLTGSYTLYNVSTQTNFHNIYFNGEIIFSGDRNTVGFSQNRTHSIGKGTGITAYHGNVAEIIMYSKSLDETSRNVTTNYLSSKYNINLISDSSSYSPTLYSGLLAYWDATKISGSSDGDSLSGVVDYSGNNNHLTQSTGVNKPTYKTNIINGNPVMRMTSTKFFTFTSNITHSSNLPFTIIGVLNSTQDNGSVFGYSSGNVQFRTRRGGVNVLNFYPDSAPELTAGTFNKTLGSFQINIWTRQTSGSVNIWQGTEKSTAIGNAPAGFTIDRTGNSVGGLEFAGDVGEYAIWDRVLSDMEIYKLYTYYYKPKWNLPGT